MNPIKTKRLFLQLLSLADAKKLLEYRSHPNVSLYQGWKPKSLEEVETFIAQNPSNLNEIVEGGWIQLGIYLADRGEIIGDCGIHLLDPLFKQVEWGISLSPEFQKQGFALETMNSVLDFLFTEKQVHRITTSCDPRNIASISLMEKIGMRKEAHHLESYFWEGKWADDVIFGILQREWKSRQKGIQGAQ